MSSEAPSDHPDPTQDSNQAKSPLPPWVPSVVDVMGETHYDLVNNALREQDKGSVEDFLVHTVNTDNQLRDIGRTVVTRSTMGALEEGYKLVGEERRKEERRIVDKEKQDKADNRASWLRLVRNLCIILASGVVNAFAVAMAGVRDPGTWDMFDVMFIILPYEPKAFMWSEWIGFFLMVTQLFSLVPMRSSRRDLMSNLLLSFALMFAARSVMMHVNQLPVPNAPHIHEVCQPVPFEWDLILNNAQSFLFVWGTASGGVHTCYDFLFSGHTATLFLLASGIQRAVSAWNPRFNMVGRLLVFVTSLLAAIGCVLLLVSREHWTVDVVMAITVAYIIFSWCFDR